MLSALRSALRQFRQHRTFASVTVLVLGLGTGAAATVFTIVDAVVLRPLPYLEPDRLVTLWDTNYEKGLSHEPISPVTFMDYRALPVFRDAAAWWRPAVNLTETGREPQRVATIETSANLFDVIGVSPQLGAGFPRGGPVFVSDDLVAVISDRLWRSRFDASPDVIGRALMLNGTPYRVVGVMPPGFHYPDTIDIWQRLRWDLTQHSRGAHFMESVLRLADGVSGEQAASAADALALRLQRDFPRSNRGAGVRLTPLLDEQLGYYRPALIVLFGAVSLLLLIACLNVASLLLTRALTREREMAVRTALGATPRQLVTQLFAESLVLSAAGALTGLAVAAAALPLVVAVSPVQIPRLDDAHVDLRTLGLGSAVVVTTTVFFGLVPALALLTRRLTARLKSSDRTVSRGPRRVYSVLVAGEVALACAMLVSAALLVRTVSRMVDTPTGVDADEVVITSVQLSGDAYRTWPGVADAHARLIEAIRDQPGVRAAGGTNFLPFEVGWRVAFAIDGEPPPARPEDAPQAQFHSVSDGYFETMQVAVASGRRLAPTDTSGTLPVVVVNATFAKRFLDGRAVGRVLVTTVTGIGPLGANLMRPPAPPNQGPNPPHRPPPQMRFEVVGVVEDVRNAPLGQAVEPAVFFSTRQFPFRELFLAVRASHREAAVSGVRRALAVVAPSVPLTSVQTWGERVAARTAQSRLLMSILVGFGALAALLAALGVYGLFSWSVALRRRELAIRLTLGAKPAGIGQLVIRHGLVLVGVGLVAGLALVRVGEQLLTRVLYEVSPTDSASTVVATAVLLLAAMLACVPPALRAMRIDPVEGLRAE